MLVSSKNSYFAPETLAVIQFVVRKCAHLTEYAVLGLLFFRALFRGTNLKWSMSILCVDVWAACVLVATADEFHQSFVESRGASVPISTARTLAAKALNRRVELVFVGAQ